MFVKDLNFSSTLASVRFDLLCEISRYFYDDERTTEVQSRECHLLIAEELERFSKRFDVMSERE